MGPTLIRKASKAFALVIAFVMALSAAACRGSDEPSVGGSPTGSLPRGTVTITSASGERTFRVEIAETEADRLRGLMFREELAPDAGMVFLVDPQVNGSFWMKNTLIPLSIAFWDSTGQVVDVLDMEPCGSDDCPEYRPSVPFMGALEVNAGALEGVAPGDPVELEREP